MTDGGRIMASESTTINADSFENRKSQIAIQAFGESLSNGMASLYRRAYRLLGNAADAEDAVHDGLLSAYTHLDQFRGQAKMSTWLTAIVHNSARMQLRRRLRHVHIPLDELTAEGEKRCALQRLADRRPSPEDECRNGELSRRLAHFQNQLTPTLRKTFELRDIDGCSIREAAQVLGVPLGTVKGQSARARKKLRQWMRRALRWQSRNLTTPTVWQVSAKVSR
jgi:RNA polymerase sigma-70 factor (ECF subfamily)